MLDSEQIGFFKANGYLLVPGIMDKQLCSELQDRMWESLPENALLKREISVTHTGPLPAIYDRLRQRILETVIGG